MARVAAITIDVDSLQHYLRIHGLAAPSPQEDPIYTHALPRFFELLEAVGVPATLFLIGADVAPHLERLRPAAGLGCEIASHSFAHDYRLFERPRAEIESDLQRAEAALAPIAGPAGVTGFRAPGYNTSEVLLETLIARGYAYDSSLLPAPSYWAARGAAITTYRARGRPSASRTGDLRAFSGPLAPYRTEPSRYWRPHTGGRLLEMPMACLPYARLPLIGTSWALMPDPARRAALAMALPRLDVFNFEMHAIDLLDGTDPGIPAALTAAQPDLAVPTRDKLSTFRSLFRRLAADRPVHTLARIAQKFPV